MTISDVNRHATVADGQPGDAFFLPDFCERWNLLLVIIIAELLAIVLTVAQPVDWHERLRYLALVSMFIQWVALTDAALLCAARGMFARLGIWRATTLVFVLLQFITATFTILAFALFDYLRLSIDLPPQWLQSRLMSNLLISITVTLVALRYFYIQHQWKLNVQAEARARIAELQARIRPHFLFNSMNTIASLARNDPAATEQAVEDLAEVFRATLAKRDHLSLADELELARSYLRIEALRLGDRLRVEWRIDDDVDSLLLPALTLQPLVENAVYHGIETLPGGGVIDIHIHREKDTVLIEIANPVVADDTRVKRRGNQIALANIEQRLQLMFERDDVIASGVADGRFVVRLAIPAAHHARTRAK